MLKTFLRDLARWADDPMTQSVIAGLGAWLVLEGLALHQRKIATHGQHLRAHGSRIGRLEVAVAQLRRPDVSRETSMPDDAFACAPQGVRA